MTAHPFIIQQRARSIEDLNATFATADAGRMRYVAHYLEPHHPEIAELARSWAHEYELLAATLRGERQIGEDAA
jgi:hypothetical protein